MADRSLRLQTDDGTAMVEFAFVMVLLFSLIFGIISFGYILSFKQDMTRAAAEGARTGAVAFRTSAYGSTDPRLEAAVAATDQAVTGFGKSCDVDGLTCNVDVHDCDEAVPDTSGYHEDDPTANVQPSNTPNTQPDCVTVELIYDNDAHPLIVPVPLIAAFMPDVITAKSVARLNS